MYMSEIANNLFSHQKPISVDLKSYRANKPNIGATVDDKLDMPSPYYKRLIYLSFKTSNLTN